MEIKKIKVGLLEANCYILIKNKDCIIIDPGAEIDKITPSLKGLNIVGVIITHYHFDHVGCLSYFKNLNIPIYDYSNLSEFNEINDFRFYKIDTKGHHNTCITIYFKDENIMFTGDFLFKNNIGRTDLEGGNTSEMLKSISLIKTYSPLIKVYPGHGIDTTLKNEFLNNIYFK